MIEAAMLWNEPNNKSHWDPAVDPDWSRYARMATLAAQAIHAENPALPRVLGGISPIDPTFIRNIDANGLLDHLDVLAVHGFPLDWNLWRIDEWPAKLEEIRAVSALPLWVTEGMGYNFYFGGTSLLIVVGVAMDTIQQIESQLVMRHYDGFMKRGRIRGRRG